MNIQDLKLDGIRRVVQIEKDGNIEEVNIFNLTGETRQEVISSMIEKQDNGISDEEIIKEIYTDILFECTDLKIEGGIEDILNSPSVDMLVIMQEINEIIYELQYEMWMKKISELNATENSLFIKLALSKSDRIQNLVKLIRRIEKTEDKIEMESKRVEE